MSQLRDSLSDLEENGQVGDWSISPAETYLWLRYPDGTERGDIVRLPIQLPGQRGWEWDHNREAPTLTPSINVLTKWHGFLRAGKLEEA